MPNLSPSLRVRAAAELERRRRIQRRSYETWLRAASPELKWDWPHLRLIRSKLEAITRGESSRLILSVPPRHGKSEQVTIRYPVFRLEREPHERWIIGAYNADLAEKFSRRARKLAFTRLAISTDRNTGREWETSNGGGLRAVGVGGGVTGHGANGIVIDDPVKSREEAESKTYREKVWDWFTNDIYTRLEPSGVVIVIQTRWHEDDLAGRLIAQAAEPDGEKWEVVNLPAICDVEDDALGRAIGKALCPERYDEESLERIKRLLGPDFDALYQGRPRPREGAMFKREWMRFVAAVAAVGRRVRGWDKAATRDGDWTAGVLWGQVGNRYVILDCVRGRWTPGEREAVIRSTAERDGIATEIVLEQEPGSSGVDSATASIRNLAGFNARAETSTGDKAVRARAMAVQFEAGNVDMVKGEWNTEFVNELLSFPRGKHDDQVDAASLGFNRLTRFQSVQAY